MKITVQHLKEVLNLERYDYKDVIGACPFTLCELENKNRITELVIWRQFLVTIARIEGLTFSHSGKLVNQDHATVIHSMKSVFNRVQDKQFPEYKEVLSKIAEQIHINLNVSDDVCVNELNCLRMLDNLMGKKLLELN